VTIGGEYFCVGAYSRKTYNRKNNLLFWLGKKNHYPQSKRMFIGTSRQLAAAPRHIATADGLQRAATRCWHTQITEANNISDFVARSFAQNQNALAAVVATACLRHVLLALVDLISQAKAVLLASYFRRRCIRRCRQLLCSEFAVYGKPRST